VGSATFIKALDLDMDLTARGVGVEQPGKSEVSDAETLLKKLSPRPPSRASPSPSGEAAKGLGSRARSSADSLGADVF
jgi:hypothetical protein